MTKETSKSNKKMPDNDGFELESFNPSFSNRKVLTKSLKMGIEKLKSEIREILKI